MAVWIDVSSMSTVARDFEAQQRHLSNLEQETNTFRHHGARETSRDRGCATRSFVLWLNVVQLKIKPVFLEIMMHGPSTDGGMTFNFICLEMLLLAAIE